MNQQLIDYIKNERKMGQTDGQIRKNLLGEAWGEKDIDVALASAENQKMPMWGKIIISLGALLILLRALMDGSGSLSDIISRFAGSFIVIYLFAYILSYILYFIFKNRIQNIRPISFSILFLIISILLSLGG